VYRETTLRVVDEGYPPFSFMQGMAKRKRKPLFTMQDVLQFRHAAMVRWSLIYPEGSRLSDWENTQRYVLENLSECNLSDRVLLHFPKTVALFQPYLPEMRFRDMDAISRGVTSLRRKRKNSKVKNKYGQHRRLFPLSTSRYAEFAKEAFLKILAREEQRKRIIYCKKTRHKGFKLVWNPYNDKERCADGNVNARFRMVGTRIVGFQFVVGKEH
jgi:hypothetical protein